MKCWSDYTKSFKIFVCGVLCLLKIHRTLLNLWVWVLKQIRNHSICYTYPVRHNLNNFSKLKLMQKCDFRYMLPEFSSINLIKNVNFISFTCRQYCKLFGWNCVVTYNCIKSLCVKYNTSNDLLVNVYG